MNNYISCEPQVTENNSENYLAGELETNREFFNNSVCFVVAMGEEQCWRDWKKIK